MPIQTLSEDATLEYHYEELVYAEARLKADPQTRKLAAAMAPLFKRCDALMAARRTFSRDAVTAQAAIDTQDDHLDDLTNELARSLSNAGTGRDARFKLYFKRAPSEVVRFGLESQLDYMKGWPAMLAKETEPALKKAGTGLSAFIKNTAPIVEARRTAADERSAWRVRELLRFVEDHNAVRRSLHGQLTTLGADKRLGRDWPDRFFRRGSRGTGALNPVAETPAETVAPAPAG